MRTLKQIRSLGLAAIVALALGCGDSPVTPTVGADPQFHHNPGHGGGPGGPPGSGGDPAQLTVRDAVGDAVESDGAGAYVDGDNHVEVAISESDFHFSPRTHRKKGSRSLTLTIGAFQGPETLEYPSDFRVHGGLLVDGACTGAPLDLPARFLWASSLGQAHLSFDAPNVGLGDRVQVTRSDNGDGTSTWTIASSGDGYLRIDNQPVGFYATPFEFTVTGEPGCS